MTGRNSSATDRGLQLIADGMPLLRAAAAVGVAPSTMRRARRRAGLPPLPQRAPWSPGVALLHRLVATK